MRKTMQLLYLILFFNCLVLFNLNLYADKNIVPPKELGPKLDINSIETSGIVTELITFQSINGQYVEQRQYLITNQKKQLIYLIKKVGDKNVDLTIFIGRKVKAKGKIILKTELTKYVDKKGSSFVFTVLDSIELTEKPN